MKDISKTSHMTKFKKSLLLITLALVFFTTMGILIAQYQRPIESPEVLERLVDAHPGWMEQWREMKGLEGNSIPANLYEEWRAADQPGRGKRNLQTGLVNLKELGPNNVGGRTRDLLFDYANPKRVLACAISGGLWESQNSGTGWKQVNDLAPNLNITSITQSPFDHNIFYYSTAEPMGNSSDVRVGGIYKSTDGAKSFFRIDTGQTNFGATWDIEHSLTDSNTIYIGTHGFGLWRSANGGVSYEKIPNAGNFIRDIEVFADSGIMVTSNGSRIVYSATGEPSDFEYMDQGIPMNSANRIEISYCDSFPNVVYALLSNNGTNGRDGFAVGVWKSSNRGKSWTKMGSPGTTNQGFGVPWYALAFEVDPVDTQLLVAASVGFTYSKDGGVNWVAGKNSHADYHVFKFRPDRPGYFFSGNDGGIYEYNWETIATRFIDKNKGYNVTQFYAGSYTPDSLGVLAGTQDNGTQYNVNGDPETKRVLGGDGAFCHINQQYPDIVYACYQRGIINKTFNVNLAIPRFGRATNGLDQNNDGDIDDRVWFINPLEMNYLDGNQLFYPTMERLFVTLDGAASWRPVTNYSLNNSLYSVGIPNSEMPNCVYLGGDNLLLKRIDNPFIAEAGDEVSLRVNAPNGISRSFISSIKVHPFDDNIIYLSLSDVDDKPRIWRVENVKTGTPKWTNISGNLPENLPCNWIEIDPYRPDSFFVAATDFGLYTSRDAGQTWVKEKRIPNVAIHQIRIRQSDRKLFVYTHGRGIFAANLEHAEKPVDPNSLAETAFEKIRLYPNPATDFIQYDTKAETFTIFDMKGQRVASGNSQTERINIQSLKPGLYIMDLKGKEIDYRGTFIKR